MVTRSRPASPTGSASNAKNLRIIRPSYLPKVQGLESPSGEIRGRGRYIQRAEHRLTILPDEWADVGHRFKRHLESAGKSPGTVDSYLEAIQRLTTYLVEQGMPLDLELQNGEYIEQYFVDLQHGGASPNTARIRFASLRVFFKWADKARVITPNPMASLQAPRPVDVVKPAYAIGDVQQMLDSCSDDFSGRRDKAALMLLWDCGLRASEFLSLALEDVDLRNGVILVRHPKGNRQRAVALGDECETALSRYLRVRKKVGTLNPALWTSESGKPMTLEGLRSMVKRHGATGLHIFRHSSATAAAANRMGEIDMLRTYGWTSIAMAKRYTESRGVQLAADAKRRASPGRGLKV
jgi:integrase/recombinase XerD